MPSVASMTGYAALDGKTLAGTVTAECRSVNSRFLDLTLRLDDALRFTEPAVRERLQKRLTRGKVELRLNLTADASALPASVNEEALRRVLALQETILKLDPQAQELSVAEILELPGIAAAETPDRDKLLQEVLAIVDRTLDEFIAAREREGAALAQVLSGYCDKMSAVVKDVRGAMPQIISQLEGRLTERLTDALADALKEKSTLTKEEVTDRIRQEVTMYAIKMDVDEEMNRLDTHLAEVKRLLAQGGAVGRKLDFMAQEMNREANTILSKANDLAISDTGIELKTNIEKVREQIQNIE